MLNFCFMERGCAYILHLNSSHFFLNPQIKKVVLNRHILLLEQMSDFQAVSAMSWSCALCGKETS